MAGRRRSRIVVAGTHCAGITRTGVGRTGIRRARLTGARISASRISLTRISAILVSGTRIPRTAGITLRWILPRITLRWILPRITLHRTLPRIPLCRILPGITLDLVVLHQSALGLRRCITGPLASAGRSSALLRCGSALLSGGRTAVLAARPGRGQAQRQHRCGQSRPAHSARTGCPDHKSLTFGTRPKTANISPRYCCLKALPTDPAAGRCYPGFADRSPRLPDLRAGPSDSSR